MIIIVAVVLGILAFLNSRLDTEEGYTYKVLEDGTVEIENYLDNSTEIDIPTQLGGMPVTSIGKECFKKLRSNEQTTVNVPATITTIGTKAFVSCQNLTITGCENVEEILDYAFQNVSFASEGGCPEFTSLRTIGEGAFYGTMNMGMFKLSDTVEYIGKEAFAYSDCTIDEIPDNVKFIGVYGLNKAYTYDKNGFKTVGDEILIDFPTSSDVVIIPYGINKICATTDTTKDLQSMLRAFDLYIPDSVTDIESLFSGYINSFNVRIYVPSSVTTFESVLGIKDNKYDKSYYDTLTFVVEAGSAAEAYVKSEGFDYETVECVTELYNQAVIESNQSFVNDTDYAVNINCKPDDDGYIYDVANGTDENGVAYDMIISVDYATKEKKVLYTISQDCYSGETVSKIIGYRDGLVYYMDSNFIIYSSEIYSTERNYLANMPSIYDAIFTINENELEVQYKTEDSKEYELISITF
jgi:hypothetical protein